MSRLFATVLLAFALSACSTPTAPTQPTAAPTVRFPDLMLMAGTYTLTIDLDESCSAMPAAARHRVYRSTLEDRGWHFLPVTIEGGGFTESTLVGDLFSGDLNPAVHYEPRLRWNSFDWGCDVREPLADGSELAVCGEGPIVRSGGGAALSGTLKGYAFLARGPSAVARCEGTHHFSFER